MNLIYYILVVPDQAITLCKILRRNFLNETQSHTT